MLYTIAVILVILWALGLVNVEVRSKVAGLASLATPFLIFMPNRLNDDEVAHLTSARTGRYVKIMILFALVCAPVVYLFDETSEFGLPTVILNGVIAPTS